MTSFELSQRFGENLKRARRLAAMSQEELGFRAELHRTEIGMLERGIRIPRIDTLIKLASSLEVPAGDLLKGIEWQIGMVSPGRFATGLRV
jgi:transcriptional regulator with XRE-family HTH domain